MLDSLDFADLQRQVEEDYEIREKFGVLMRNLCIWALFFAIFALLGTRASREESIQYLVSVIYLILSPFIIIIIISFMLAIRNHQLSTRIYRRFSQFVPSYVAHSHIRFGYFYRFIIAFIVFTATFILSLLFLGLKQSFLLLMLMLFLFLIPRILTFLMVFWVNGDKSHQQLARTKILQYLVPYNPKPLYSDAGRLYLSGNLPELEQCLHTLLSNTHATRSIETVYTSLNWLSAVLIADQRYEQALPMIEATIRISPNYGIAYGTLAELYLEQGIYPDRVVALIDRALEYLKWSSDGRLGIQIAKARALALLDENSLANVIMDELLPHVETLLPYQQAEVYRQAGYVRRAQGDEAAARELFTKAVQLDPDGLFGKLAQRALDTAL